MTTTLHPYLYASRRFTNCPQCPSVKEVEVDKKGRKRYRIEPLWSEGGLATTGLLQDRWRVSPTLTREVIPLFVKVMSQ